MNTQPIKTKAEYRSALKRLDEIFDAASGAEECDELEILGLMVDNYEKIHYPIEAPDPIEAIKIRLDEN
jgi:HTH-type transcriptional regulator/antitoxin HigA